MYIVLFLSLITKHIYTEIYITMDPRLSELHPLLEENQQQTINVSPTNIRYLRAVIIMR